MSKGEVRRAKDERKRAELIKGGAGTKLGSADRPLFESEFYVVKIINVANLDQKAQFEALNEIATMQMLESPHIVGYYDSFIDDEAEPTINIVIEFCPNGDLSSYLEKQEGRQLSEN